MPAKMAVTRRYPYRKRRYSRIPRPQRFMRANLVNGLQQKVRTTNLLQKSQYCDFEMSAYVPVRGVPAVTLVFSRFDYEGIIQNVYGINTPPLWDRAAQLFEAYAVKGFSLEWVPTNVSSTTQTGPIITDGFIYQDLNTYNIGGYSDTEAQQSNGFQIINVQESFKIMLDNAPLAKSQNTAWPATQAGVQTQSNGLPGASVAIRIKNSGWPNNVPLGTIKATWYVTMRGIKPAS